VAGKRPIDDERNELVLKELEHIHVTIARLETTIGALAANLDSVRVAELKRDPRQSRRLPRRADGEDRRALDGAHAARRQGESLRRGVGNDLVARDHDDRRSRHGAGAEALSADDLTRATLAD